MRERPLVILSAAHHYRAGSTLFAYEPYVREIDIWCTLFPEVVVVAPFVRGQPPEGTAAFTSDNLTLQPLAPAGGETLTAKARLILVVPSMVWAIVRALRRAGAVHVRCPGNVGLLGVVLAPLFSRRLVAKYAGQWTHFPGEAWTVRLQRALLRSRWWRGPVTVYGEWPDQPENVVPVFSSVLEESQIRRGALITERRHRRHALRVLVVGRLSAAKNVATVIRSVADVARDGVEIECRIVGDGEEGAALRDLARHEGIDDRVEFAGAVPFEQVLHHYEWANTLVLASESEGWPKAIAEAMAFGLACVGSDRGLVPQMLSEGRGLVVRPGDSEQLAERLRWLATHPQAADAMGRRAAVWSSRYSIERLGATIADLLTERWGTPVPAAPSGARISIIQVVDSLEAGGAERMAVNLANLLPRQSFASYLCTTRGEGPLAADVAPDVRRVNLNRRYRYDDVRAVHRLARLVRQEGIDVIHAHGTSLFIAAAAQRLAPESRLVWHDHLGDPASRDHLLPLYRWAARRAYVISVNGALEQWARGPLGRPANRVTRIPNFVVPVRTEGEPPSLPGTSGRRVVCVANLRKQKDHLNLVAAMARVIEEVPDAHLLLIGGVAHSSVEGEVRIAIDDLGLDGHVSHLGERDDVAAILRECAVGVLSSRSEGLPLALLEYGLAALPVVSTSVGDCPEVLDEGRAGILVPPGDPAALASALICLLLDAERAERLGGALRERVGQHYSPSSVLERVAAVYSGVGMASTVP